MDFGLQLAAQPAKDLFELAGETPQLGALKTAAEQVAACLRDYQEFLQKDLLPRATGDWRLDL